MLVINHVHGHLLLDVDSCTPDSVLVIHRGVLFAITGMWLDSSYAPELCKTVKKFEPEVGAALSGWSGVATVILQSRGSIHLVCYAAHAVQFAGISSLLLISFSVALFATVFGNPFM
ncbi:hypothetical protein PHAVU_007G154600 [Phaseolus vulgaris]|uniref:Uncharacterized protein n=1 Tax=Phaseolus vulgaris TaxID=3885 RepID=V7BHQ7_PHAVU|nr:hypothetical protein PHAVU_007G154600g [Phaseolus vulgaris]ESW16413.1 hypothetical protein PHAVU_007G154600g [Phaseolus vulgaris]